MAYTVKKLAKLSGVSVRTLHFYDEIELLKPAFYGENNYRYYEEEQLFSLQQILFYRELGFKLNDIQRIISSPDFNKVNALESHRKILLANLNQTQKLIETIDKTIAHLRGKTPMKNEELYYGFDSEKQKEHEKYLIEQGIVTAEFLDECNKKVKTWPADEKNAFIHDMENIMKEIIQAMENGFSTSSEKVQKLMHKHYHWLLLTWTPTKESYLGLTELYQAPEFRKFYDARHPKLLSYFIDAMKIYANRKLP